MSAEGLRQAGHSPDSPKAVVDHRFFRTDCFLVFEFVLTVHAIQFPIGQDSFPLVLVLARAHIRKDIAVRVGIVTTV